jgi:hypothetical protein
MEEAALTLTSLWKMVAQDGISQRQPLTATAAANCGGNSDGNNNDKVLIITIVEEFVLPSLIACAVALSSFDNVPATAASDDASGSSSSRADNDDGISNQALETGEDCIMALFTCIQSFFIPIQCDNNINNAATNNSDDCKDDERDNDNDFLMHQCEMRAPHRQYPVDTG